MGMARAARRWDARTVWRVVGTLLALMVLSGTAAQAADDDVAVTITSGPGVILEGVPALHFDVEGRLLIGLDDVQVLDTTGSGAGWTLQAGIRGATAVVDSSAGPSEPVLDLRAGDVVTLTAAPAAL